MSRATKVLGGLSIASLIAGAMVMMISMVFMFIPGIITGCILIVASPVLEALRGD